MHCECVSTPAISQLLVMQQSAYNNVQMAVGLGPIKSVECHVQMHSKQCLWMSRRTPSRVQTGINELTYRHIATCAKAPAVDIHARDMIEHATSFAHCHAPGIGAGDATEEGVLLPGLHKAGVTHTRQGAVPRAVRCPPRGRKAGLQGCEIRRCRHAPGCGRYLLSCLKPSHTAAKSSFFLPNLEWKLKPACWQARQASVREDGWLSLVELQRSSPAVQVREFDWVLPQVCWVRIEYCSCWSSRWIRWGRRALTLTGARPRRPSTASSQLFAAPFSILRGHARICTYTDGYIRSNICVVSVSNATAHRYLGSLRSQIIWSEEDAFFWEENLYILPHLYH